MKYKKIAHPGFCDVVGCYAHIYSTTRVCEIHNSQINLGFTVNVLPRCPRCNNTTNIFAKASKPGKYHCKNCNKKWRKKK